MSAPAAAAVFASVLPVPDPILDAATYPGPVGQWFVDTERWVLDQARPALASADLGAVGVVNAAAAILADVRGGAHLVANEPIRYARGWLETESDLTVADLDPTELYEGEGHGREYREHVALFTAYRDDQLAALAAILAAPAAAEAGVR